MVPRPLFAALLIALLALVVAAVTARSMGRPTAAPLAVVAAAGDWGTEVPDRHPVTIHRPDAPSVVTTRTDSLGRPVSIACDTCHSLRDPVPVRFAADLDEFHEGLTFTHGDLACAACHNPDDHYATLRLADGTAVEFPEVMTLCAQCHGPQRRDYDHGAHGGMNGYWDLTRGPRTRNGCTVCHDPHAPAFGRMRPTFKPIDRFLTPENEMDEHE